MFAPILHLTFASPVIGQGRHKSAASNLRQQYRTLWRTITNSNCNRSVNQSLAGIERIAVSVAKNASEGIDGMTASMVKASLAGNLLAEAIKGAAESVKDYVAGAVEMAAHTERLRIGTHVLAKARGLDAKAARASRSRSLASAGPLRSAEMNFSATTRFTRESRVFHTSPRPPASAIPQPGGRDVQCHLILGFEPRSGD